MVVVKGGEDTNERGYVWFRYLLIWQLGGSGPCVDLNFADLSTVVG